MFETSPATSADVLSSGSGGRVLTVSVDKSSPLYAHTVAVFTTLHAFCEECKLYTTRQSLLRPLAALLLAMARCVRVFICAPVDRVGVTRGRHGWHITSMSTSRWGRLRDGFNYNITFQQVCWALFITPISIVQTILGCSMLAQCTLSITCRPYTQHW